MGFFCQQCGECCSIMGEVLSVSKDFGGYRFLVANRYTGEETPVEIDPDKHDLFLHTESLPSACPFLRYRDEKAFCTVHLTRPEMCRDFGCWRLLIIDRSGGRAGRVMYQRFFCSEEPSLALFWDENVRNLDEQDDQRWDDAVIEILSRAGYTVIR